LLLAELSKRTLLEAYNSFSESLSGDKEGGEFYFTIKLH
jgi:hypothetical protein